MSDLQGKVVLGAAVVATGLAASLAYLLLRQKDEPIPTRWKKVGKIVDLNFFPVKSCGPIKKQTVDCHQIGIKDEEFFDRCFIVSCNNRQITARTYPKFVFIRPKIEGNILTLSAPEKNDLIIDLNELKKKKISTKVQCWTNTKVKSIDVGDDAAEWISGYLAGKKESFRLLYYPYVYATKGKEVRDKIYKAFLPSDAGAYHDVSSYMIINQASIDDMNNRLDHVVKPLQFRPNFVVDGPGAYAEDNWKWVRIGDVIFRAIRPCTRCISTNINPDTGERNLQRIPLEILAQYRSIIPNDTPLMGLHLGIRVTGQVSIDDDVYVEDE